MSDREADVTASRIIFAGALLLGFNNFLKNTPNK